MNATNAVFAVTFATIAFGFFLKKFNFITELEGKTLSKFVMHTTFPALLLISMARVKLETSLSLIPMLSFTLSGVMLLTAWFWFRKYPNPLRGLLTMGSGGFNSGMFGFPIIESLFGRDNLVFAIMFDIGNTFIVFGCVYTLGNYFSENKKIAAGFKPILKKIFTLPAVIAMVVGMSINIFSIHLPTICFDVIENIAKANKPIVLLLMGIYLSFDLDKPLLKAISKVLAIRYSWGLLTVAALYYFLAPYPMMRNVLMLNAILPIGMTILPFSDEFHFDSRVAGTLLNLTLLISFVLMWGIVSFLQ